MDPTVDRKVVRQEQEKAFFNLKKSLWNDGGVLRYSITSSQFYGITALFQRSLFCLLFVAFINRYYIQLPTEKAHLYHDVETANLPPLSEQINFAEEQHNGENNTEEEGIDVMQDIQMEDGTYVPSRLHPLVAEKICELVAQGHNQVYTVRKQLRYRFSITFLNYLQKKRIYEHSGISGTCFILGSLWNARCSSQIKCPRDTICVTFQLSMTSRTTFMRLRKLFR